MDFDACDEAGIKVAAPNLGHPAIDLMPEFARLCRVLLEDAGVDQRASRFAVVCDTPCAPFLERMLAERGARVGVFSHPVLLTDDAWEVIIVAMRPSAKPPMDINSLGRIARRTRQALLVQFSGGIEILGAAPVIRRLTGGLKAAEAAYRGAELGRDSVGFLVKAGFEMLDREHA
ncbi:MAG: hypothetical protein E5W44_04840 [Mesorhizobium sp.]|nr:MAG: hypothetical protein E5W44_04840 [Mesorhizobium sp.]